MPNHCHRLDHKISFVFGLVFLVLIWGASIRAQTVTHLHELTEAVAAEERVYRDVDLAVTICAASRPEVGVVIASDDSGAELLELGNFDRELLPGERVRIQGSLALARRREMGVQLSASPVVNNDGVHIRRTWGGWVPLTAGRHPFQLEWFNNLREFNLELNYSISNSPLQSIAATNFSRAVADQSGQTNFLPGLNAACYEGYWDKLPDFDLLQPVKTGVVTNLDLGFRSRDERVGIRFTGFFDAPQAGDYLFRLRSDDGSLLFLGKPELPVVRAGHADVLPAKNIPFGAGLHQLTDRQWMTIEGRADFITRQGKGINFQLCADHDVIRVCVADAAGLELARLQNARVRVTGVGRGALTASQRIVLGAVYAANAAEIQFLENQPGLAPALPVSSIAAVQSLPLDEARRSLPVCVRGVVTDSKSAIYERFISVQDDTRGIFVGGNAITNPLPAFGEAVEIRGHSGAGDFAPVITADSITSFGLGRLPEPVRPTWNELLNGSLDVQWAELQGVVTAVRSNTLSLLMPEGQMDVVMDGYDQPNLEPYVKSVVRIRGVLYAMWNAATREVRVGSIMMRNAAVSVAESAPADPFDAVVKTPRELLLFDSQATAFRRVKVRGQVVYADESQLFLEADGTGLRVLPSGKIQAQAGDLVEVVGYPDIRRTALLLRDARLRTTGKLPLPRPKPLVESDWTQNDLDATRVRVAGQLLGWHMERGSPVLEMQSGQYLYLARLKPVFASQISFRPGSRLQLDGVYVGRGSGQRQNAENESFELLLNSPADIAVLSQPPWWTLPRLLILLIGLMVILAFAGIWISQLRRLVEQRTSQLRSEIQERERIEREHALEAERSRIARDLHDDLGASLTEISVLASTGQRPKADETMQAGLFQAIAGKARKLIAALDVIVWAVDPEDNSLQSFADYVTGHTEDFFSHTNISCRFKVPVAFPAVTLEGRVRHDLLMAVKEAFNNIVRHAEATEVEFRMAVEDSRLVIEVADNGKGFDGGRDGHGLKNLPARLIKLGGACAINSQVGGGTTVSFQLPLALPAEPMLSAD